MTESALQKNHVRKTCPDVGHFLSFLFAWTASDKKSSPSIYFCHKFRTLFLRRDNRPNGRSGRVRRSGYPTMHESRLLPYLGMSSHYYGDDNKLKLSASREREILRPALFTAHKSGRFGATRHDSSYSGASANKKKVCESESSFCASLHISFKWLRR